MMNATRPDIDRSIQATKAALAKLSPAQIDQVLDQTRRDLEAFIKNEWIPTKKNAAEAEAFHASVRVHSFGWAS
jgi:hypothetical protein